MRDDCKTMSPSESRNGREADSIPEGGILAALPRARPQRASARRVAARGAATKTSTKTSTATARQSPGKTNAEKPATAAKAVPAKKPVPAKQGVATKKPLATKAPLTTKTPVARKRAKPVEPLAPKQGYEPEDELELGKTVHPPSGVELVESVADIFGELANSSLAVGGRLLKDAFSLLRRP